MEFFYRGRVMCMQGNMKLENFDFIVDLIDEYIDLKEAVEVKHDR